MRRFVCFITADAYLLKLVIGKSLDSFSYCWSPEAVYKLLHRILLCHAEPAPRYGSANTSSGAESGGAGATAQGESVASK